mgnify:FL=1|jgi:hypothetical protein
MTEHEQRRLVRPRRAANAESSGLVTQRSRETIRRLTGSVPIIRSMGEKQSDSLVSVLMCVVCGLGAAVRVKDQHLCSRCAVDYQLQRQEAELGRRVAAPSAVRGPG